MVPIGVRAPDQGNAIVADLNSYVATADKLYPGKNAVAR